MISKSIELTKEQLDSFRRIGSAMGSLATLPMPGTYPVELISCGVNERGIPRNQLLGFVVTQPSGSQLALETVFFDSKDDRDKGDLHVVNFESKTLTSYYQGWGTWVNFYGNKHWEHKDYLRAAGTTIGTMEFRKASKKQVEFGKTKRLSLMET